MKNTKNYLVILLGFTVLFSVFISNAGIINNNIVGDISNNNLNDEINQYLVPPIPSDEINSTNVYINVSSIYRGHTMNITLNTTGLGGVYLTIDHYKVNITLNDQTQFNISMVNKGGKIFEAFYTPWITNTTGFANLTVIGVDANEVPVFVGTEWIADYLIQIKNNLPVVGVTFNTYDFLRGETMELNFAPSDYEDPVALLDWEISLYNSSQLVETFIPKGVDNYTYFFEIPMDFIPKPVSYYINGTCWDSDGDKSTMKYFFSISNNEPVILDVEFLVDGEPLTENELTTEGIKRSTEVLTIQLNCTDDENNDSLTVSYEVYDPQTGAAIFELSSDLKNTYDDDDIVGFFTRNITFPKTVGLGIASLEITLKDISGDEVVEKFGVLIKNNDPIVEGFSINASSSDAQLSFKRGDLIAFTFNVTDEENNIKYVQVNIFYQDGELIKTLNYSLLYENVNTTIYIRARDLPSGDFFVYASVIDGEGGVSNSDYLSFSILPTESSDWSTWVLFVVGIIIGLFAGGSIIYWRSKNKEVEAPSDSEKSKEKSKNTKESLKDSKKSSVKTESKSEKSNKTKSDKKVIRRL